MEFHPQDLTRNILSGGWPRTGFLTSRRSGKRTIHVVETLWPTRAAQKELEQLRQLRQRSKTLKHLCVQTVHDDRYMRFGVVHIYLQRPEGSVLLRTWVDTLKDDNQRLCSAADCLVDIRKAVQQLEAAHAEDLICVYPSNILVCHRQGRPKYILGHFGAQSLLPTSAAGNVLLLAYWVMSAGGYRHVAWLDYLWCKEYQQAKMKPEQGGVHGVQAYTIMAMHTLDAHFFKTLKHHLPSTEASTMSTAAALCAAYHKQETPALSAHFVPTDQIRVDEEPFAWVGYLSSDTRRKHPLMRTREAARRQKRSCLADVRFLQDLASSEACKYIAEYHGDNAKDALPFIDRLFAVYNISLDKLLMQRNVQEHIGMMISQISVAVYWLHEKGVAHGDIHAGNVFVEHDKGLLRCRLGDLGRCSVAESLQDQRSYTIRELGVPMLDWLHTVLLAYHMRRVCATSNATDAVWLGLNWLDDDCADMGASETGLLKRAFKELDTWYGGVANTTCTQKAHNSAPNLLLMDCVRNDKTLVQNWAQHCLAHAKDIQTSDKIPRLPSGSRHTIPSRAYPLFRCRPL